MPRIAKIVYHLVSVWPWIQSRLSYLSANAASQQDSKHSVENNGARKTLDGLLPDGNVDIAVSLYG